MSAVHISLGAEKVFDIAGFPVTNALLTSWIVIALLTVFSMTLNSRIALVPGNVQSFAELIIDFLKNLYESVLHDKAKTFFTFLATIFIYIISLNWIGLLPGVGTIVIKEIEEGQEALVPLFRAGTADLNTTLALALLAVVTVQ